MGVLGVGVWLRLDPKTSQFINAADGLDMYYIGTYILIGAGGLLTIVGFVGCCGAFQESAWMLGTFFVILFLILCAEIAGGVFAYLYSEKLSDRITDGIKKSVQVDYGSNYGRTQSVDFIQKSYICCGSKGPTDYVLSSWFQGDRSGFLPPSCCLYDTPLSTIKPCTLPVTGPSETKNKNIPTIHTSLECCGSVGPSDYTSSSWSRVNTNKQLPNSCCKLDPEYDGKRTFFETCVVLGTSDVGQYNPALHNTGCARKLFGFFEQHLDIILGTSVGVVGVELLGMICSMILCCVICRQGGYRYRKA
ncbi:tetraspanin-1-like [Lineus longissimus]|uniref:tetraspanin-1-like n=1 Tax=Lineus longissimus TaxID=88925 RepID=UPI00315D15D1